MTKFFFSIFRNTRISDQVIDFANIVEIIKIVFIEFFMVDEKEFFKGIIKSNALNFSFIFAVSSYRIPKDTIGTDKCF